jgi:hypothetical protein
MSGFCLNSELCKFARVSTRRGGPVMVLISHSPLQHHSQHHPQGIHVRYPPCTCVHDPLIITGIDFFIIFTGCKPTGVLVFPPFCTYPATRPVFKRRSWPAIHHTCITTRAPWHQRLILRPSYVDLLARYRAKCVR